MRTEAGPLELDRIDLADIDDPERLAQALHRQLGATDAPVPVVEIARALDIVDVRLHPLDGLEGALVTDAVRSYGVIAANTSRGSRRARFTVAHELGHFLMERHRPTTEDGFACRGSDMRETRAGTRHQRQEMEANRFAISALAPPRMVAPFLREDPDLGRVGELAKTLDISREAAARRYVDLHDQLLAVVWSVGGVVRYSVRNERFPWLEVSGGNRLSGITPAASAVAQGRRGVTRMTETSPAAWIGSREVELFEQTRVGRDGHASDAALGRDA